MQQVHHDYTKKNEFASEFLPACLLHFFCQNYILYLFSNLKFSIWSVMIVENCNLNVNSLYY